MAGVNTINIKSEKTGMNYREPLKVKRSREELFFGILAYIYLAFASMFCLIPFLLVIGGSFSSESSIKRYGFRIIPKEFSLEAYSLIFRSPRQLLNAYGITIFITTVGTFSAIFLISMTAYVLHRKDFKYRNKFALYFYFTNLFNGGLVPWYILMVRYLKMKNNLFALIIPLLFSVFYMIIIRTFMSSIPDSISESAKIDGAGDFTIFIKLILPLSKPALATIGLFVALNYWNDWFNAMLFIEKRNLIPLQYYLHQILSTIEGLRRILQDLPNDAVVELPGESFKMAMTVVTIGPIILLYPYLQKYFIKGIMLGAVKG